VRVVFASGYSTGEILRNAPDARSAAFIGKPYTLEGLSIALRKAGVVNRMNESSTWEPEGPEAVLAGRGERISSMRILVAEDQSVSRHILAANLHKWGYDVTAVEDGTRAWEALQAEDAPQLAILDWLMPGMDGIEICRQIRQHPQSRPVI
jgi:PleD family two-component response regulator